MLRITLHDNPRTLLFQLEGRLEGPWVRELEECWRSAPASTPTPVLRVDLTGVTFIDEAGKACLAAMYRWGAQLIAADCQNKAIVDEIARASLSERAGPKGRGKRQPQRSRGAN